MRVKLVLISAMALGCGEVTKSDKKDASEAAPASPPAAPAGEECRTEATCKEQTDALVCRWKTTCDATGTLLLPTTFTAPKDEQQIALAAGTALVGTIGLAYDAATNAVKLPEGKTIPKDTLVALAVLAKKPTTFGDFQCLGENSAAVVGSGAKEFRPMTCITAKPCDGATLDLSTIEGLTIYGIRLGDKLLTQPSTVKLTEAKCALLPTFPIVAVEAYKQPAELIPESECATMRAELEDKIKTYVEFTKVKACEVDADCVFSHYPEAVPLDSDCGNYQVYAKTASAQYDAFLADSTVESLRRRLAQGLCLEGTQKANLVCSIEEQKPACIDKACKPKP